MTVNREQIIGDIERQRINLDHLRERSQIGSWRSVLSFTLSLKTFLFWQVALYGVQVLEIFILAAFHRIYLPPESLLVLRVLSSVGLLALLSSLAMRVGRSRRAWRHAHLPADAVTRWSRLVFQLSLLFCLATSTLLILCTTLHFSAPPIFRAVLLASLVTLPYDSLCGFMFTNARGLPRLLPRQNTRWMMLASQAAALLLIWLNEPLLYLAVRILPHIALGHFLWSRASACSTASLYKLVALHDRRELLVMRTLFARIMPPLAACAALELSFFAAFWQLKHLVAVAPLCLFFLHKLVHLALAIALRLGTRQFAQWQRGASLALNFTQMPATILWPMTVLTGVLLSAAFSPLLLLQRNFLVWASPLGELDTWPALFPLLLGLSIFARTWSHATLLLELSIRVVKHQVLWLTGLIGASVLITSGVAIWGTRWHSGDDVLLLTITIDALFHLLIGTRAFHALRRSMREAYALHSSSSRKFLQALWHDVRSTAPTPWSLVYLHYRNPWDQSIGERVAGILKASASEVLTLPMSKHRALLLVRMNDHLSSPSSGCTLHRKLVSSLGANLEECQILKTAESSYAQIFGRAPCEMRSHLLADWLAAFSHRSGLKVPEPSAACSFIEAPYTLDHDRLISNLKLAFPLIVVTRADGWDFSSISEPEVRRDLMAYAEALHHHDALFETSSLWAGRWRGFGHLVDQAGLTALLWLPPGDRSAKAGLEMLLHRHNLYWAMSSETPQTEADLPESQSGR